MFSWFRSKFTKPTSPQPSKPAPPENPPKFGHKFRIAFANGEQTWTESGDILDLLEAVLQDEGQRAKRTSDVLELQNGIILKPEISSFQPIHPVGAKSSTTIQAVHPETFPAGVLEYQHAAGESFADAVTQGFQGWARGDLPVLLDSLQPEPKICTGMTLDFPEAQDDAESLIAKRQRRVLFGLPARTLFKPLDNNEPDSADLGAISNHAFCPCCLFTHSMDAFKELLAGKEFVGLRLYAARDQNGEAVADCRVNGKDFPEGQKALVAYVETWPDLGVEIRKQYVVIQTLPVSAEWPT